MKAHEKNYFVFKCLTRNARLRIKRSRAFLVIVLLLAILL